MSGYDATVAFVIAEVKGYRVRFVVMIPSVDDRQFRVDGRGSVRGPAQRQAAADAEEKRLWRCLLLAIKAKLEVVESGIESFEEAFLANIVLPDGSTTAENVVPMVVAAYGSGQMPELLPFSRRELGDGS